MDWCALQLVDNQPTNTEWGENKLQTLLVQSCMVWLLLLLFTYQLFVQCVMQLVDLQVDGFQPFLCEYQMPLFVDQCACVHISGWDFQPVTSHFTHTHTHTHRACVHISGWDFQPVTSHFTHTHTHTHTAYWDYLSLKNIYTNLHKWI